MQSRSRHPGSKMKLPLPQQKPRLENEIARRKLASKIVARQHKPRSLDLQGNSSSLPTRGQTRKLLQSGPASNSPHQPEKAVMLLVRILRKLEAEARRRSRDQDNQDSRHSSRNRASSLPHASKHPNHQACSRRRARHMLVRCMRSRSTFRRVLADNSRHSNRRCNYRRSTCMDRQRTKLQSRRMALALQPALAQ